ncbi:helix-turn-helix domain-containing protein [Streptomyces sp. KLOTTS4A1]|uniref:helix-turn-helix domain-containing protein n=1 Tax=Streptomyces sp. KLOTTS4A1 TaxID=3390996 RepID=UPI0039F63C75
MSIGNSHEDDRPSIEDDLPLTPDTDEERPSVGRALQLARLEARLTVDEVSAATRVRVPIVHAIEQDDFSRCGGDVYARGHIRSIARAVDTDPAPLLAQFTEEHGGKDAPSPATPLFEAERIRPEPRRPNWTAAMVAAIVAVVGFVGFTLFSDPDQGSKDPVAEGSPSATPSESTGKPAPKKPADPRPDPADSAIAGAPKDKVTVLISADEGESWVSVKGHTGASMFDGMLKEGQTKTFTDDERIDLVLGNAGAIKLFVNGKEIKDDFRPGAVERLSYTKEDQGTAAEAG